MLQRFEERKCQKKLIGWKHPKIERHDKYNSTGTVGKISEARLMENQFGKLYTSQSRPPVQILLGLESNQ